MFALVPCENSLSEPNKNLYSADPCEALQNECINTFVRAKKLSEKTCKTKFGKMAA
jgi:hypothetical protein